ncbi:knockout [Carabus blaptoides fortunei]
MCSKGQGPNGAGPKPCHLMLRHCLAIQLRKEGCQGDPGEFWMYDSGYLLFQGLLAANSVCWWNGALSGATRGLCFRGYVAPGALLVTAEPCALEIVRGAWARRVLKPPAGYIIVSVGDIEDCLMTPISQGHFTPLPEAVCEVVLQLTSQGRPAVLEPIRRCLAEAFPHIQPPAERVLYDTLSQLTTERKIYQTARGYFIVTPERRRSRSHSRGRRRTDDGCGTNGKGLLMSTEEALVLVHGEMATIRDGDVTHQCIQTNLADVICGGNASDKVLYPRTNKRRSASFPAPRSLERRSSFRLWGSNRRLRRSASTRTIAKNCTTDSSSSTEYPTSSDSATTPKKGSLLSRLFRRSKRSHCHIKTFSAQFPPTEWFNSRAIHLHSVATQTTASDKEAANPTIPYYYDNSELSSARNPPSPTKSYDSIGGSIGNMYYDKYLADSKSALEKSYDHGLQTSTNSISNKIVEKNTLGSEPNLSCKIPDGINKTLTRENSRDYQFPSLSDLSFNFTSLTAQKILKGVSINSIDTLVELNMAATGDKPNNCDVVHTDFGLV